MKNLLMAALVIGCATLNGSAADTPKKIKAHGTNNVTRAKAKPGTNNVAAAKAAATETPLEPGPYVANQKNVNVRGQAAINSEVVVHLKKGDKVTVLEEVTLKKHGADEPGHWAKIALPESAHVWVHSMFIDSATKTVKPKKLNLRSGPGENYSVIGRIEQGAEIKEIETKGEWIKIEPPAGSYAFVAAHLITKETPVAMVAAANPTPPVPQPVNPRPANPRPIVPAPVPTPPIPGVVSEPVLVTTPPANPTIRSTPPVPAPVPTPPPVDLSSTTKPAVEKPVVETPTPVEEELVKRVVTREGLVRRSVSIQAPTYFVLESLGNGKTMNYLHATTTNIVLKEFHGQRVIVTGEEALDERWPRTPVIEVETLQAVP